MIRSTNLRCPEDVYLRVEAWAKDQPTKPSINQSLVTLLTAALDAQRQGLLDQILAEVQSLRADLDRSRRLRKVAASRLKAKRSGAVVEAKVIP